MVLLLGPSSGVVSGFVRRCGQRLYVFLSAVVLPRCVVSPARFPSRAVRCAAKAPRRALFFYRTMLISGGGGGRSLPAVGAPTLTLLLATAAETLWKNLAKALASMVSSEATMSVSCRK